VAGHNPLHLMLLPHHQTREQLPSDTIYAWHQSLLWSTLLHVLLPLLLLLPCSLCKTTAPYTPTWSLPGQA
jgi:hypothetical protein